MSAVADTVETATRPPRAGREMMLAGERLVACRDGALWWAAAETLIIADMHLEKGSSYAERGVFLPPYDTAATLDRLAGVMGRYRPQRVIALGDSFHDQGAAERLNDTDRAALARLTDGVDWIWIAGNHDPRPPRGIAGAFADEAVIGALTFRHEPRPDAAEGEISGHLHPAARLRRNGRSLRRRCYALDGRRLVLPAFGALTGGLNVLDAAFAPLFDRRRFTALMIGAQDVYPVSGRKLVGDMTPAPAAWSVRA